MKELPLLLNGPMVRAIRDGRKTQTRRPVKHQIVGKLYYSPGIGWYPAGHPGMGGWTSPFGTPGDLLYVRETFLYHPRGEGYVQYRADNSIYVKAPHGGMYRVPKIGGYDLPAWRPSIHMPRWASRLTLRVLRVWTERVQEIEKRDAIAEGVYWSEAFPEGYTWDGKRGFGCAEHAYFDLYGFDCLGRDNPLVWACEFEVVKGGN